MNRPTFEYGVALCLERDARFTREAYVFVRDALDHTQKNLAERQSKRGITHVSGPELLGGFRSLALGQFGPLAKLVLETWGLHTTGEVGQIVFNLIETGVFSKSDTDCPADFEEVFDFDDAFDAPFRPVPGSAPTASSALGSC